MHKKDRWFDRKFHFDLPIETFPNIVERLRGTPARMEERVQLISPEILRRRNGDGWSIQEHVGHLLDLEPLWATRLDEFLSGASVLMAADLENRKTHEANHNNRPLAEILMAFRKARLEIVTRLDALDETHVVRIALHPRLAQPMNVLALAYFTAEHDDHHLAVITSLARMFDA